MNGLSLGRKEATQGKLASGCIFELAKRAFLATATVGNFVDGGILKGATVTILLQLLGKNLSGIVESCDGFEQTSKVTLVIWQNCTFALCPVQPT